MKAKAIILGVAHGSAMLDVGDEDTGLWLKVLSMGSRLLRWVACSDLHLLHNKFIEAKKLWPENSTLACWWQTIDDRVLLCGGGSGVDEHVHAPVVALRRVHGAQGRAAGDLHPEVHSEPGVLSLDHVSMPEDLFLDIHKTHTPAVDVQSCTNHVAPATLH